MRRSPITLASNNVTTKELGAVRAATTGAVPRSLLLPVHLTPVGQEAQESKVRFSRRSNGVHGRGDT